MKNNTKGLIINNPKKIIETTLATNITIHKIITTANNIAKIPKQPILKSLKSIPYINLS
jgi:hypothetical protein